MSAFGKLRRYLTLPSRSASRIARDVHDELQLHLDLRTEELVRLGVPAAEARARAARQFGDVDDAARYCVAVDRHAERRRRALTWWSELAQDARHTLRTLRRAPAFTAATVVTLAVALGASTAVSGVLYTYLVRPLPFPDSDRLVWLDVREPPGRAANRPSMEQVDWAPIESLFASTVTFDLDGFTLVGEPFADNVTGSWVTAGYFPMLGIQPALGRAFRPEEYRTQASVAIIGHALWRRRFGGDTSVIGRTVTMHSTDQSGAASSVTIVGVLPRDFWSIQWRETQVLRPFAPAHAPPQLARLAPGTSRAEAERRIEGMVRAQLGQTVDSTWHMKLTPALEQHGAPVRRLLIAIFGAAAFMLLAACGSVAGALVSRTAARRREISIRIALGASRARLLRQLLTESAVLGTIAGALGLAIAYLALAYGGPLIERRLGTTTPGGTIALRPAEASMLLAMAVSVVTGALLGLLPASILLRARGGASPFAPTTSRGIVERAGGSRVRRVVISGQVAVATVLLFGAGLMFRTIARMNAIDLGFRTEGVIKASILLPTARYGDSTARQQVVDRLLARIVERGGAERAAAVFPYPFRGGGAGPFPVLTESAAPDENAAPRADVHTVTPDYFGTMGIALRTGRTFTASDDRQAPLTVMVSEGLARRLDPSANVVGRRIRVRVPYSPTFDDDDDRPWRTIVGVVADARDGFELEEAPDVYVPYAQNPRAYIGIVARAARPDAPIVESVRRAAASVDPALVLSGAAPFDDVLAEEGGQRRSLTALLSAFALFSLALAALALYASLSYVVIERRTELALRLAVGASARSILRLVVSEGVATTAVGLLIGAGASLALGRVLASQLYEVSAGDPATLATIAGVLALVATVACVVPAARATRIDPALALRE